MLSCLTWLFLYSYLYFFLFVMQRGKLKKLVQCLLEAIPTTRDSDAKLYKELAKNYFTEVPYFMMDIEELLTKLNYQSMRDTRQVLQAECNKIIERKLALWESIEDIIDIRGDNYNKRHHAWEIIKQAHLPSYQEIVESKIPRYQK